MVIVSFFDLFGLAFVFSLVETEFMDISDS